MDKGTMTVREIADAAGIHFSAVSRCFKKPQAVSKKTYIKIAGIIGVAAEQAETEWNNAKIKQLRQRESKYGSVLESKGDRA